MHGLFPVLSLFSQSQGLSPKQSDFLSTLASVISVNKVILCVLLKNSFTFKYAKHFYLSKLIFFFFGVLNLIRIFYKLVDDVVT